MFSNATRTTAGLLRRVAGGCQTLASRLERVRSTDLLDELRLVAGNAALKDLHAGQRGFVIGNGPSLEAHDLHPLADQVTFVANGFWRHPLMEEAARAAGDDDTFWQPTYYAIVDPLYFDGSPPIAACMEKIRQRTRRCTFLVSVRALPVIRGQGLLPLDRVRPCLFRGDLARGAPCSCDLSGPIPHVQSVSCLGLLAALYTGCNPIYLLGMDHDWLSRPVIRCEHFYAEVSVENHPTFEAIERGGSETYLENMEAMAKLWRSYLSVQALARQMGVTIFNASRGGYLDIFPRVAYQSIVQSAARRAPSTKRSEHTAPASAAGDQPHDLPRTH